MKTMKLRAHASCQCKINVHESGRIDFISYTTRVISIIIDGGQAYG